MEKGVVSVNIVTSLRTLSFIKWMFAGIMDVRGICVSHLGVSVYRPPVMIPVNTLRESRLEFWKKKNVVRVAGNEPWLSARYDALSRFSLSLSLSLSASMLI